MALCKTHTVIPLCGNNDLYTLDAVEGEGEEWEQTFLQELETPKFRRRRYVAGTGLL